MARKKGGGHGGGGHGWFVTFADLMALLMSFFVMLTAMSTQDQKKIEQLSGSFRDAFGVQSERRLAGVIERDGTATHDAIKNVGRPSEERASRIGPGAWRDNALSTAAASMKKAMHDMPELARFADGLTIEETTEGVEITLAERDNLPMFPEGAREPYDRTRFALEKLATLLRRLPNRLVITGHTNAIRPGATATWEPFDLSAGRAIAVRDILVGSGIQRERFAALVGKGAAEPAFPEHPFLRSNGRVSILIKPEMPSLPAGSLFR
jgi:chemotaxis protein MotB